MIPQALCFQKTVGATAAVLALFLAPVAAWAQQGASPAAASQTASSGDAGTTEVRSQNGISYVTGGISQSGQQRVKALGKDMNLQLVFAKAGGGDYVADVDVSIAEKGGHKVLELKSVDPLLFVQLKPGSYVVTATAQGKPVERTVSVPAKGQQLETFSW